MNRIWQPTVQREFAFNRGRHLSAGPVGNERVVCRLGVLVLYGVWKGYQHLTDRLSKRKLPNNLESKSRRISLNPQENIMQLIAETGDIAEIA
ncbi:MAG: hypothetical protein ACKOCH_10295, partial [Bacteroidota bacterium]